MRFALALLFFASTVTAVAGTLPDHFSSNYVVKKGFVEIGESRRTLTQGADGQFVFESFTTTTGVAAWVINGSITERSTWTLKNGVIQPVEYYFDRVFGKGTQIRLLFDWNKNTVTNVVNQDPWVMRLEPGTLDRLVYQIALMRDMTPGKREYAYRIADGGRIKTYRAVVLGDEETETPAGKFLATKIARVGDKRGTTLWLAPKLNYLPVRIEQSDNGSFVALLKSFDGITPK